MVSCMGLNCYLSFPPSVIRAKINHSNRIMYQVLLKDLVKGGDYPGSSMLVRADELEARREAVNIELVVDVCARLVIVFLCAEIIPFEEKRQREINKTNKGRK